MGYSVVPGRPEMAFASSHPVTGGKIGVIRAEDAGRTCSHVSDDWTGRWISTTWRSAAPIRT